MFFSVLIYSALVTHVLGAYRCDTGVLFINTCLRATGQTDIFTDARSVCTGGTNPGDVIKVTSAEKEAAMVGVLTSIDDAVWIGVHNVNNDYDFTFMDGTALTSYQPWVGTPPLDAQESGKDCTFSYRDVVNDRRLWITEDCNAGSYVTVCERPAIEYTPLCDPGWHLNKEESACIKVIKNKKRNFQDARSHCQGMHGDLATQMSTRSQISQVMSKIKFRAHFWIGVHAPNSDGNFENVDGSTMGTRLPWKKGRPTGPKHCVTLRQRRWFDKKCTRRNYFICQKKPTIPVPVPA